MTRETVISVRVQYRGVKSKTADRRWFKYDRD